MKHRSAFLVLIVVFILLIGLSCTQRGNTPSTLSQASINASETRSPLLTSAKEWMPPVFPGAIADREMDANMTAVATTPQALDETASNCFGFIVHDAVFYAYRSDANEQEIMDFYSKQMSAAGWKRIAIYPADSSLPRWAWQQGIGGRLVTSVLLIPMQDNRTVIYWTVAETNSPQTIIDE